MSWNWIGINVSPMRLRRHWGWTLAWILLWAAFSTFALLAGTRNWK